MLKITPYIEIDGIRTFTDAFIRDVYSRIVDDNLESIVFSDGNIKTPDDFLAFMKYGPNYLFIIETESGVTAILWLNRILDRTCYAHFCGFKDSWGEGSVDIGRFAMDHVFNVTDDFGKVCFETIHGLIPAWNTTGIGWLKKVGLVEVGRIPNALWSATLNKSTEGVLMYLTRDILEEV